MLIRNSFLALVVVVPASATALETTSLVDLAAGVDGDGAGPLAVAAAVSRQPIAYAARDSAPSPHKNADLGALTLKQRQANVVCLESCPTGFFGYCDGVPIGPETCGDDCCVGNNACFKFTGCVKGDGSCSGEQACHNAHVPMIENGCKEPSSCHGTGYGYREYGFYIDAIKDSCNGVGACRKVAYYGSIGGTITNSCNGPSACLSVAENSRVESITQSCNGHEACKNLSSFGSSGPITKSCNSDQACVDLAHDGSIASITKTCNNDVHKPCAIMPQEGNFGHMINRVHAETGEKYTRDIIESIAGCMEACKNDDTCNGIKWKEHTGRPCRFFGGALSENPCNGRNVCITA